jgi:hypothetical protein
VTKEDTRFHDSLTEAERKWLREPVRGTRTLESAEAASTAGHRPNYELRALLSSFLELDSGWLRGYCSAHNASLSLAMILRVFV